MHTSLKITLFFLGTLFLYLNAQQTTVVYEWNFLNFAWESETQYEQYLNSSRYIPANNIPTSFRIWNGEIYMAIPRLRPGVPATLARLTEQNDTAYLEPFPSLEIQDLTDSLNGINSVQAIEIDPSGRMFILDSGRYNTLSGNVVNAPARLFVYDLANSQWIRNYTFPNNVVSNTASNLHDMVLDLAGQNLYIVNMFGAGSIVVYNWANNTSYLWQDASMQADLSSGTINVNGTAYNFNSPIDGIALSRDGRTLFYSPLRSRNLFSIDTMYLRNTYTNTQRNAAVINWGIKGFTDGMTFSNNGKLYFGDLVNDAVRAWNFGDSLSFNNFTGTNGTMNVTDYINLKPNINTSSNIVASDPRLMWPSSFAWDNSGYLWFLTNRLNVPLSGSNYDVSQTNFRMWKTYVNGGSYLQSASSSVSSDNSEVFSDSEENNGVSPSPYPSIYNGDSLYQSISGCSALSSWLF